MQKQYTNLLRSDKPMENRNIINTDLKSPNKPNKSVKSTKSIWAGSDLYC